MLVSVNLTSSQPLCICTFSVWFCQTNQSISQSTNQSINQSINQTQTIAAGRAVTMSNRLVSSNDRRRPLGMLKLLVSSAVLIPSVRRQRMAPIISERRVKVPSICSKLPTNCDKSTVQPTYTITRQLLTIADNHYIVIH